MGDDKERPQRVRIIGAALMAYACPPTRLPVHLFTLLDLGSGKKKNVVEKGWLRDARPITRIRARTKAWE
jgi:hypothetical protein